MGCSISTRKRKVSKDTTFDGDYVAVTPPTRGLSKRMWRNRNSYASSSGVSSGCDTPARGSKIFNSRSNTPESPPITQLIERRMTLMRSKELIYENLPPFLRHVPLDIDLDDDQPDSEIARHINSEAMRDDSGGYYTEENSSDCSTPHGLVCTHNGGRSSEGGELDSTSSDCELDLEMQMMAKVDHIMPKTSSPCSQRRRDMTFNISSDSDEIFEAIPPPSPPSASYQKWSKYLQMAPTYTVQNITSIPEAIAGHFCPAEFPRYTELNVMPKDLIMQQCHTEEEEEEARLVVENIAETIIMELPVPTISTEL